LAKEGLFARIEEAIAVLAPAIDAVEIRPVFVNDTQGGQSGNILCATVANRILRLSPAPMLVLRKGRQDPIIRDTSKAGYHADRLASLDQLIE
jgi:predicted signal transduction protein with EAL and GGDEF domain